MKEFFIGIFTFVKTYPGILYSVFLIIFIPFLLYWNTFYITSKFEKNIEFLFHKKALFLQNTISIFAKDFLKEPQILQSKIESLAKESPEVKYLRVLVKEDENFRILSSFNREEVGGILESPDPALVLSWSQGESIASLISLNKKERAWRVISPIFNENKEKVALVSFTLSLKESDQLTEKLVFNAFLITIFAIALSLILIFQHANLFGYVALTKKLKELDKAKDEFIRMATHELQSPIVNIRAYIADLKEMLKEKLSFEGKENLKRIEISAKNLSNLISDILEVSRIEQGRLDFTPQKLNLKEEIKEIISEFEKKAKEKNLQVLFEEPKEEFFVQANKLRFREIISNLLDNAIKYTFRGFVKIKIGLAQNRRKCYIFVEDTGIGISAQAQRKLFQKFFRERKRETADIPGTGLGLWISKEIAEKMGGEIFLESIEGQGSKFIVSLPLF